jgi:hypothetical protein
MVECLCYRSPAALAHYYGLNIGDGGSCDGWRLKLKDDVQMPTNPKRQFDLKGLFAVTFVVAVYFAGMQLIDVSIDGLFSSYLRWSD